MMFHWPAIASEEMLPGLHGRMVHTEHMTAIWWDIDQGADLPEHSHPHEQIATLISGEFELVVDGQVYHMQPHSTVCIPAGAKHSGRAISDCVIYDVFSPVREDYRR